MSQEPDFAPIVYEHWTRLGEDVASVLGRYESGEIDRSELQDEFEEKFNKLAEWLLDRIQKEYESARDWTDNDEKLG